MYKIFILFLILVSCTQYTAVTPPKPEYTLTLDNSINELNLYENNGQVFIENIGSQLIIELDYNINLNNMIIYDILVPNEKLYLYTFMERPIEDVIIKINRVEYY